MAPIRVAFSGSPRLRTRLRNLCGECDWIDIVDEGNGSAEEREKADTRPPDVFLLDISDDPDAALSLLKRVQANSGAAHVLILSSRCSPEMRQRLILAGVRGLVLGTNPADHLLAAIRKVHANELWIDRATAAQIITTLANGRHEAVSGIATEDFHSLTRRERDVIALVATGLSNKAIASRMNISDHTVRHYMTSIFEKLDVPDRLTLIIHAFRNGLVAHVP